MRWLRRLSPFVSGCVYTAYAYFVITLIPKSRDEKYDADRNSSFPNSWRDSAGGKVGLVFFGIAFVAATIVQLEAFFTRHGSDCHDFACLPCLLTVLLASPFSVLTFTSVRACVHNFMCRHLWAWRRVAVVEKDKSYMNICLLMCFGTHLQAFPKVKGQSISIASHLSAVILTQMGPFGGRDLFLPSFPLMPLLL